MTHEPDDAALRDLIRRAHEAADEPAVDLDESLADIRRRASRADRMSSPDSLGSPQLSRVRSSVLEHQATIAIVTALPIETLAVRSVLDDVGQYQAPQDPNHYLTGTMPSRDPSRRHVVVVAQQASDSTQSAAGVTANIARTFPRLSTVIMCGIAGGVSEPSGQQEHVHLGDVVIAAGRSTALLQADDQLRVAESAGHPPWLSTVERLSARPPFQRPSRRTDPLDAGSAGRPDDHPLVHRGVVASADRLLRDTTLRDGLASQRSVIALEMEAAGIGDTTHLNESSWFTVRGIADYGDKAADDRWHSYAALTAAAYVRSLLGECLPEAVAALAAREYHRGPDAIVDALLEVPQIRTQPGLQAVISQLPVAIAAAVPRNPDTRLGVLDLVQTCARYPGGAGLLSTAIAAALDLESPAARRIESVIDQHWAET